MLIQQSFRRVRYMPIGRTFPRLYSSQFVKREEYERDQRNIFDAVMKLDERMAAFIKTQAAFNSTIIRNQEDFKSELKSIKINQEGFKTELKVFKSELESIKINQEAFRSELESFKSNQEAANERVKADLINIKRGIGGAFEKYNKVWLSRLIPETAGKLTNNFLFPDPEKTVHAGQKSVEFDLFCSDPLVIAEVKTYIDEKQFRKLETFARKVSLVRTSYGSDQIRAFVLSYGYDKKLPLNEFSARHGIEFIFDNDE